MDSDRTEVLFQNDINKKHVKNVSMQATTGRADGPMTRIVPKQLNTATESLTEAKHLDAGMYTHREADHISTARLPANTAGRKGAHVHFDRSEKQILKEVAREVADEIAQEGTLSSWN